MRISGITIPEKKHLFVGLTAVYGIGLSRSKKILSDTKIPFSKKPADLTPDEEAVVRRTVEAFEIEGALRRSISSDIKRLKEIGTYRGKRHQLRLPARGQQTQTNSRTLKGAKKTIGSGKIKLQKK